MSSISALTLLALANDQARVDRVATNIANVQTPGYKREIWANRGVADPGALFERTMSLHAGLLDGAGGVSLAASTSSVSRDLSAGTMKPTGRPLDLALTGAGFFEVATEQGPAYTRRGEFLVDARGRLTNADGWPVMGTGGEISLTGTSPRVDASGRIYEADKLVAQIKVVDVPGDELQARGHGLYVSSAPTTEVPAGGVVIRQGFLENANVDMASEMVSLTATMRHFEAMLRVSQGRDELLGTAIRKLGEL